MEAGDYTRFLFFYPNIMLRNILTIIHVRCRQILFATLVMMLSFITSAYVWANGTSSLNQTISDGTLATDIVDGSGNSVSSPSITFGSATFSFNTQDSTGTLGTASQKIRVSNPTGTAAWTVNLAASTTTDTWTNGTDTYDFNDGGGYTDGADTDSIGGQLTVDPSSGTLTATGSGCTTTNVSKGTSDSFVEGTLNSVDLMSATTGANTYCRWDLTGVGITQKIPAAQKSGAYTINMVLTVS